MYGDRTCPSLLNIHQTQYQQIYRAAELFMANVSSTRKKKETNIKQKAKTSNEGYQQ